MKTISRVCRNMVAACCLALAGAAPWGLAQAAYPEKPIHLVVPFEADGAADVLGRLLASQLGTELGQRVEVLNKPGDGTALAADWLARQDPDGYTLMVASISTLVLNPAMRKRLAYDPVNSFTHLGMVADLRFVVVTSLDGPASMTALVEQAKTQPGGVKYGSAGYGSGSHFAGEMVKSMTGMPMLHVPTDGSNANLRALMDKKVLLAIDSETTALPVIRAGKVRALATLSSERIGHLPEVPTMIELGYPELTLASWLALVGPGNLPEAVRQRLETALAKISATADFRSRVREMGMNPTWGNGQTVVRRIRAELPKMVSVVHLDQIKY